MSCFQCENCKCYETRSIHYTQRNTAVMERVSLITVKNAYKVRRWRRKRNKSRERRSIVIFTLKSQVFVPGENNQKRYIVCAVPTIDPFKFAKLICLSRSCISHSDCKYNTRILHPLIKFCFFFIFFMRLFLAMCKVTTHSNKCGYTYNACLSNKVM